MFIETYYDDRAAVPGSTSEPMIPYPELSGEKLTVWQEYLPIKRPIRNLYSPFNTIPDPAIAEIKKATRSFDRIEIWLLRLTATGGILGFLVVTLAARAYGG